MLENFFNAHRPCGTHMLRQVVLVMQNLIERDQAFDDERAVECGERWRRAQPAQDVPEMEMSYFEKKRV